MRGLLLFRESSCGMRGRPGAAYAVLPRGDRAAVCQPRRGVVAGLEGLLGGRLPSAALALWLLHALATTDHPP